LQKRAGPARLQYLGCPDRHDDERARNDDNESRGFIGVSLLRR